MVIINTDICSPGNNSPKHEPNPIKHNDLLESDDNAEDRENEEMGEMKSSHELRTLRLQKKIKEIETDAVKAKSWQMTGEVAAVERPENALLQEHLDYETVSKQAPIITEEVRIFNKIYCRSKIIFLYLAI